MLTALLAVSGALAAGCSIITPARGMWSPVGGVLKEGVRPSVGPDAIIVLYWTADDARIWALTVMLSTYTLAGLLRGGVSCGATAKMLRRG